MPIYVDAVSASYVYIDDVRAQCTIYNVCFGKHTLHDAVSAPYVYIDDVRAQWAIYKVCFGKHTLHGVTTDGCV